MVQRLNIGLTIVIESPTKDLAVKTREFYTKAGLQAKLCPRPFNRTAQFIHKSPAWKFCNVKAVPSFYSKHRRPAPNKKITAGNCTQKRLVTGVSGTDKTVRIEEKLAYSWSCKNICCVVVATGSSPPVLKAMYCISTALYRHSNVK